MICYTKTETVESRVKGAQIRLAGNSVCEDVAEALVAANVRGERSAAA